MLVVKENLKVANIQRRDGSVALLVSGTVRNDYPVAVQFIQVQVNLFDASKNVLASGMSYCDVSFTNGEVASMPEADLKGYMDTKAGRNMNNLEVKAGEQRDFAVVFSAAQKC